MKCEIYNGDTFMVPATDEAGQIFQPIPTIRFDEYAMAFLLQDGNLAVPCGRYGDDTFDCAKVAIALAKIMRDNTGESVTYEQLNNDMGLVVNSADDVAYMIREYGPTIGIDPDDFRGMDDDEDGDLPMCHLPQWINPETFQCEHPDHDDDESEDDDDE